jgi:hypothetical protein
VGYVRTISGSVFGLDLTKLRRWSALRRGALVVATLIVGTYLTDPETGALASVSSLFVGLQDRNASSTYTSRVMLVQSFVFAGVVLLAGVFSENRFVPDTILVATAVVAGLAAWHDKAISRMFGDVMPVAAFLGLTMVGNGEAVVSAVAVLLGGLIQALSARLTIRVEGDIIERRVVAAALVAVADHLDDALVRQRTDTGRAAEQRLTAAVSALSASDLARDRRRALRRLLADAEILRQEAGAVRLRRAHDLVVAGEDQIGAALEVAARALRATAAALTSVPVPGMFDRRGEASLAELYPCRLAAEAVLADAGADLTARALARQTLRLYHHVARMASVAEDRRRDRTRRVGEGMSEYLRHPDRRDVIAAARLGAATVISFGLAELLQVPHGSWVASTSVALLRPDHRALTADTVARALGTAAGAALVIPLVWLTSGIPAADVVLVLVLASVTFVIAQANEGLYVMAVAVETVFTRAVVGEDPISAAVARVTDVALGSAIAIAFLVLIPISHGRRLAHDLADYTDATAAWIGAVGALARGEDPKGWKRLRQDVRDARVHVQHGLELRVIEPWGPGITASRGEGVFTRVHEVARVAAAVERALKHGEPSGPGAPDLAGDAAATLRRTAMGLRGRRVPEPDRSATSPPGPPGPPGAEGAPGAPGSGGDAGAPVAGGAAAGAPVPDLVTPLLRHATEEADGALAALLEPA